MTEEESQWFEDKAAKVLDDVCAFTGNIKSVFAREGAANRIAAALRAAAAFEREACAMIADESDMQCECAPKIRARSEVNN